MNFILLLLGISVGFTAGEDSYEYEYDEVTKTNTTSGGTRLVGARTAKKNEAPFVVAMNILGQQRVSSCTGSLITPTIVLTAAHCTMYITEPGTSITSAKLYQQCVEKGFFFNGQNIKCKYIETSEGKNLEITTVPKGSVWAGVADLNSEEVGQNSMIKRALRHAQSYKGGARYGTHGGYDISLLELETPISGLTLACVPQLGFDDIQNGKLGGYGSYQRNYGQTCQTNRWGKNKYHYCDARGTGKQVCKQDPAPRNPECKTFLEKNKQKVPKYKEEVMILHFTKQTKTTERSIYPSFCLNKVNPENSTYGWCTVKGNYYDLYNPYKAMPGWGYCSKDCYLDPKEGPNKLRVVDNAEVLSENLCEKYLQYSLRYTHGEVKIKPEILCVGHYFKWNVDIWLDMGNGRYSHVSKSKRKSAMLKKFHYGAKYDPVGYVTSAGTCHGDSGGPLYVETKPGQYVVTGVVSGGRGELGGCGGINNPVHYTRVKKLAAWIREIIGDANSKKVCWTN